MLNSYCEGDSMRENKYSAKTKYQILIFGAFVIFFTGYPHIWSIYQPYAMELTGWSQSQASMGFFWRLCREISLGEGFRTDLTLKWW